MPNPGAGSAVGPFPPEVENEADREAYDKRRRRVLWAMSSGLYVLGTRAGSRRNAMTMSWATQLDFRPKLLGVSVERTALSHELLLAGPTFVLNLVARRDRAVVRRFTKPVEVDEDAHTLNGFPFRDAPVTGAPVLGLAMAWIDCEVRRTLETGTHTLFVGEVVDCGFQQDEGTELLRIDDTRFNYGG